MKMKLKNTIWFYRLWFNIPYIILLSILLLSSCKTIIPELIKERTDKIEIIINCEQEDCKCQRLKQQDTQ
jgi:hypothetical protein